MRRSVTRYAPVLRQVVDPQQAAARFFEGSGLNHVRVAEAFVDHFDEDAVVARDERHPDGAAVTVKERIRDELVSQQRSRVGELERDLFEPLAHPGRAALVSSEAVLEDLRVFHVYVLTTLRDPHATLRVWGEPREWGGVPQNDAE